MSCRSARRCCRKQLIRALSIAFDYIEEMEKGVKAADVKEHYRGLVGARKR